MRRRRGDRQRERERVVGVDRDGKASSTGGYLEFEAGPVRLAPGQADLPN